MAIDVGSGSGMAPAPRTVGRALADGLARHEVTLLFGQSIPAAILQHLPTVGIRQVTYRTETAGGVMADGFARASNRVGVVTAQNGPAATLLVPPLGEALKSSIPLVALVQDVARAHLDRNAFQEFDHLAMFGAAAKWVKRLEEPSRALDYLDMAFVAATSGRPGPAVLLLPEDVLLHPYEPDERRRERSLGRIPLDRPQPDPARVEEAADLLSAAQRPLIIAGGGIHLSDASAALADLQHRAQLPVATTNHGKGSVDETAALSLGVIGNAMGAASPSRDLRALVRSADTILLVGTRTAANATDSWSLLPEGANYIHLDVDPGEIGRNYESVRIVADARAGLVALERALDERNSPEHDDRARRLRAAIAEAKQHGRARSRPQPGRPGRGLHPRQVVSAIADILDHDTIAVADASYATLWLNTFVEATRVGQRFLTPRGLAGIGWGFPMALGAQLARPDAHVVCLAGDGGFGHAWSELETAVREDLRITLIILNNGILGFQQHAELVEFGHHTSGTRLGYVDHAAVARACGAAAFQVQDVEGLEQALAAGSRRSGTTLIDVLTDPESIPPITAWDGHEDVLTAPQVSPPGDGRPRPSTTGSDPG